jgi:hypothetical protein
MIAEVVMQRRTLFATALAAAFAPKAFAQQALVSPEDEFSIWTKLQADLSGRTVFAYTTGTVWGFKPQADDVTLAEFAKPLYGYVNVAARKATKRNDGAVVMKTRNWIMYLNPVTHAFMTEMRNPYTDKMVKSSPMASPTRDTVYTAAGPEQLPVSYPVEVDKAKRPYQMQVRKVGDKVFLTEANFTRLKPGNITWWKLEGQMMSYTARAADVRNTKLTHIPNTWSHNLVAEWQTWMEMHGTPGHILFKGDGTFVDGPGQLPADIRATIEEIAPGGLREVQSWS